MLPGKEFETESLADSIIDQLDHINPLISEFEIITLIESKSHRAAERILIIQFILENNICSRCNFANGEKYWLQEMEKLNSESTQGVSWVRQAA